jgi:hypothetical protein
MTKSRRTGQIVAVVACCVAALSLEAQVRRTRVPQGTSTSAPAAQVDLKAAVGYTTPRPDGRRSCTCNELERRLHGLRVLLKLGGVEAFAQGFPTESQQLSQARATVQSQLDAGSTVLDGASGKSYAQQEHLCGEGLAKVEGAWSQWQPFLGQHQLDSDYYRGVRAANPGVPEEGDLTANASGRVCTKGSWWNEDRALWAINGREGICKQESYRAKEILRGQKGDPGHRCFGYELK